MTVVSTAIMPKKKIVVIGDITVDWLSWRTEPTVSDGGNSAAWQPHPGTHHHVLRGGAITVADILRTNTQAEVVTYDLPKTAYDLTATKLVNSHTVLTPDYDNHALARYRVSSFGGFTGDSGVLSGKFVLRGCSGADMVVMFDLGNGFENTLQQISRVLKLAAPDSQIICRISRVNETSKLLRTVTSDNIRERVTLVVNADVLRASGFNISRKSSWDRIISDTVRELSTRYVSGPLLGVRRLIIRYGNEAAMVIMEQLRDVCFCYFPAEIEDHEKDNNHRLMPGTTASFMASYASSLLFEPALAVSKSTCIALAVSKAVIQAGFPKGPDDKPEYPWPGLLTDAPTRNDVSAIKIFDANAYTEKEWRSWSVLKHLHGYRPTFLAREIVRRGIDKCDIARSVPRVKYGDLTVIHREEIEALQSIKNLILEYLAVHNPDRPLSIAVFGPPGSGKSTGVKNLAKSIPGGIITELTFNVSEFERTTDLAYAFHRVRDEALSGKIPLVFFDEFDVVVNGELVWLSRFLAPMQDGRFRDTNETHPVGKAIFVFAGGTAKTYAEFISSTSDAAVLDLLSSDRVRSIAVPINESGQDPGTDLMATTQRGAPQSPADAAREVRLERFKRAKGPDFVSRLRGYINVPGLSPSEPYDSPFNVVRVAMSLRYQLWKRAPELFVNDVCAIDSAVSDAFFSVRTFLNENRSLEAILDMSLLAGRRRFELASLPSKDQLNLHVTADSFEAQYSRYDMVGKDLDAAVRMIYNSTSALCSSRESLAAWSARPLEQRLPYYQEAVLLPELLSKAHLGLTKLAQPSACIEIPRDALTMMAFELHQMRLQCHASNLQWLESPYVVAQGHGEANKAPIEYMERLVAYINDLPTLLRRIGLEVCHYRDHQA